MKSLLILIILLTAVTVSLCRRPEKKEKFLIVVKGNDEKNSTSTVVETKPTNTTRLENISLDYKHDFKKLNKTDDAKKLYKFEAKDGRIYKREKSIPEEVTQEPNNSNDNHVLSLPPTELEQQPLEKTLPENLYVHQPNPYMAFKLCPVSLENVITDINDKGPIHYVPHPYLYQATSQTGYRIPKKVVIRYKPILEVVDDSAENLGSNPYDEAPPASYGPISSNGFMVVYPNGMAKMVEPMSNGLVGNDIKSEPTSFSNGGIYYHDGLKEYEFQIEDNPVIANDRYRIGKAIQYEYVNSEHGINDEYQSNIIPAQDPQFYTYVPTYTQENTEYRPVVNTYEHNALNSNADHYTHGYNQEHFGISNTESWPRNENLYGRVVTPIANVNYEYNTDAVTDHQYLLPSENTMSESNVQYTPSLDNSYDNSNLVEYNANTNQYQTNKSNDYRQQNYEVPANHNHQYNDANVGVSTQNHNDYSNVNTQNILHNHNLNIATPIQQNNYKRTAASGKATA